MKFILPIIFCIFFFSCSTKEESYLKENIYSESKFDYSFDEIKIKGDSLILPYYAKMDVFYDGRKEYLYGYNHTLHSLDIFDLELKEIENRILLDSDGPDGIDRVYQIKVISQDSIAIMQGLKLGIIDSVGKVIQTLSLAYQDENKESFGYFYNYNDARIVYKPEEKSFILHFMNETVRDGEFKKNDPPFIFGEINLHGDVMFFPITYPQIFFDRNGNVAEHMPNYSFNNGKLIYGFTFESNIYTFDFKSGKSTVFGGKSAFSQNMQDFDLTETENYRLVGTWFNRMVYDPKTNFYYRTHWGSQPVLQIDSSPSTALTKPGYIMIFNKNFEIVSEIELPQNYWLEDSFLTSEGLFFWPKDNLIEDEDVLELGLFNVNL